MVGQGRLEFDGEEAVVSNFIDKKFIHRGYMKEFLRLMADKTRIERPNIKYIRAEVLK